MMGRTEFSEDEKAKWDRASDLIDDARYAEAKTLLDEILSVPRTSAKAYAHRGLIGYRTECFEDAIAHFSEALTLKPGGKNTLFLRGRSYEEAGKFEAALDDYDKVIEIAPKTADAHAQRGFCLERLDRLGEAIAAYEAALLIDPDESLALAGLKKLRANRP